MNPGVATACAGRPLKTIPSHEGFPKIRDNFLGVPIIRTIIYWGLYWGTLILGTYLGVSPKSFQLLGPYKKDRGIFLCQNLGPLTSENPA